VQLPGHLWLHLVVHDSALMTCISGLLSVPFVMPYAFHQARLVLLLLQLSISLQHVPTDHGQLWLIHALPNIVPEESQVEMHSGFVRSTLHM
jgi:hypothetical protein